MFFRSIWAEPMRASLNWGLAPVLLHPTFVTKQLMMFKSAGCLANYECSQKRSTEGRYSPVKDSCENLVSNLGQGVTSRCSRAWPSVSRTWKRPQQAEMREANVPQLYDSVYLWQSLKIKHKMLPCDFIFQEIQTRPSEANSLSFSRMCIHRPEARYVSVAWHYLCC